MQCFSLQPQNYSSYSSSARFHDIFHAARILPSLSLRDLIGPVDTAILSRTDYLLVRIEARHNKFKLIDNGEEHACLGTFRQT